MHRIWVAFSIVPMLFQKYLSIIFHKFCSATAVCQYEQHVSVWIRNALSDQKSLALDTDTRVGVGLYKMRDLKHNYLSSILSFCEGDFRQKCSEQMNCIIKVFMRRLENGTQRVITENQWL